MPDDGEPESVECVEPALPLLVQAGRQDALAPAEIPLAVWRERGEVASNSSGSGAIWAAGLRSLRFGPAGGTPER